MFNSDNGYSLADIAAVAGGGNGFNGDWGGNGAWWIIILFLFAFAGNGWNGFGGNGNSPASDVTYGFDMSALHGGQVSLAADMASGFASTVAAINDNGRAIQSDICNMGIANLQNTSAIQQAINASTIAGMQNTFGLSTAINALSAQNAAEACNVDRDLAAGFAQLNYNLATEACADRQAVADGARDIIENQNNNTRQILDFLIQDRITALTTENQALKGQISQSEQNAYLLSQLRPQAQPSYLVANPYTGILYPYTYGANCGCGCGSMGSLVG